MSLALIIAQHDVTAGALQAVWELARLESAAEAEQIVVDSSRGPVTLYDHLVGGIQAWIDDKKPGPGEGLVLVDQVQWSELNPLAYGWSSVIAMLVLTYPELRWVFGVLDAPAQKDKQEGAAKPEEAAVNQHWHQITGLFRPDHDPIFDLSGLRWHIRDRVCDEKDIKIAPYIPQRNRLSAALDDEPAYAYFHAYTAYRYGYRSVPVIRDDLAQDLFGIGKTPPKDLHLTLEDVFLSYPDQQHAHYSELSAGPLNSRAKKLPGLGTTKTQWRVFVTSGQSHQSDAAKSIRNRVYISNNAGVEWAKRIFKPLGGIFDLWETSGLRRRLKWAEENGRTHRGVAKNFVWPPKRQSTDPGDTGHSAPGRLALVATQLIERARRLLADDHLSIPDAVKGAVFATDALELLGDRTPTSAIEALSLKHQFEVLAECGFPGVEYHLVVKPRLQEIQRELGPLSVWFHRSQRKTARLNAEMTILNRLIQIFRDHGEFDEEQICMNRARHLHNTLWMREYPARLIAWPALRYVELLLGSFSLFAIVIVMWIAGLSGLYWVFHSGADHRLVLAAEDAITSFFSIGGPIHHGPEGRTALTSTMEYAGVVCLSVVAGCVHLGIFISHLYSIVARK